MLATEVLCEREQVMLKLQEMGLDQISNWINELPEDKWKEMFVLHWPTLVRECGIRL